MPSQDEWLIIALISFSLRAIIRTTLASSPPSTAGAFTAAARKRLAHTITQKPRLSPSDLFTTQQNGESLPSGELAGVLRRSRALYGAGLAFASLGVLASVVRGTVGLRWELDGEMADTLAAVDADIAQALQSAREEFGSGRMGDLDAARAAVKEVEETLSASLDDTTRWEGEFPFERALDDIQHWKL